MCIRDRVDSSVGGKTGVDLPQGKNLVGAFWQPRLVLIDPDTLNTLPPRYFADGMGEVVKYGCIRSRALFDSLRAVSYTHLDVYKRQVLLHRGDGFYHFLLFCHV